MRGYINIPGSIHSKLCRQCGSRPVIALVDDIGYVVKCSASDNHYQTMPDLIDIDDWNKNNTITTSTADYNLSPMMAW